MNPTKFFLISLPASFMHIYVEKIVVAIAVMPKKVNVLNANISNLCSVMYDKKLKLVREKKDTDFTKLDTPKYIEKTNRNSPKKINKKVYGTMYEK